MYEIIIEAGLGGLVVQWLWRWTRDSMVASLIPDRLG